MAVIKPSYDTNRTNLRDVVPLDTPYTVCIEPTRMCNLKCFYCMHGTRGEKDGILAKTNYKLEHIDMDLYDKIVSGVMEFPEQPKRIVFSGLGEPLLNPNLGEMVKRLRKAGFSQRIDIFTNAVALTPAIADELTESGVNRFIISVQGLTSEKYKNVAGVPVDIERYINNIEYLYTHKKNTEIYIKIIDACLNDEIEKEKFFLTFGSICDTIFVEHLVVLEPQMGDHGGKTDRSHNVFGELVTPCKVCSYMFYLIQVCIDGNTFPCCIPGLPQEFSAGNIMVNTLEEIWNGNKRTQMLQINLEKGYEAFPICRGCVCTMNIIDPAEYLDDCTEKILEKIDKRQKTLYQE